MTTPLASLPTTQNIAAAGGGVIYLGANANPTDANADFTFCPTGAGKHFVIDTTSTQPFIIRQLGGTPGTNELQMYHGGTTFIFDNHATVNGIYSWQSQGTEYISLKNVGGSPQFVLGADGAGTDIYFSNGGGIIAYFSTVNSILGATIYIGQTIDTTLARTTAGVITVTDWIRDTGMKILDADATNATNTLVSSNITFSLKAGRSYSIKAKITGGNSLATEGFKVALTADGTLTATRFDLAIIGSLGTIVAGTQRVTSLGTPLTDTTFTAPSDLWIVGEIKVGVAGVLTLQFAENSAHVSGTATLSAGSWVELQDCVAV